MGRICLQVHASTGQEDMIIKEVEEWNRRKSSSRIGLVNKKSKVKIII